MGEGRWAVGRDGGGGWGGREVGLGGCGWRESERVWGAGERGRGWREGN